MLRNLSIACLVSIFSTASFAEEACDLKVTVENVASERGQVMIGLEKDATIFDGGELHEAKFRGRTVAPNGATVTTAFANIPEGVYAIKVFHDRNENMKLDTNFFGIPKEPFGFSNDAKASFGPPSFEQASFRHTCGQEQKIALSD